MKHGSCAGAEPPHRGAQAVETATEGQQEEKQHLLPPWFRRRGKVIMVGPCCSRSLLSPSLLGEEDLSSQNIALTAKLVCIRKGCRPCIT